MPEHTLEELKELAKPALRHAELINLARVETPSGADEKASIRWPRRQAKAVRFLAMLRRDHGQRAFEALVSSTEHARPKGSEHAQGDTVMVTLDSLYPVGIKDVVLGPPDVRKPEDLALCVLPPQRWKAVSLKDEVSRLKLTPTQERELVRRLIDSMLANNAYTLTWGAALLAAKTYFGDDKALYKKILVAMVSLGGLVEDAVSMPSAIMPEKLDGLRQDGSPPSAVCLQMVVDHMLESGCSEKEVRSIWSKMLRARFERGFFSICIYSWWKGLKIGEKDFATEALEVNRQCLLRELQYLAGVQESRITYFSFEEYLEMVHDLCHDCGFDWCRSDDIRTAVEDMFIHCFASGQVGRAFCILKRFGGHFNVFYDEARAGDRSSIEVAMQRLMRGALDKACDDRNFGIATALAEHLGDIERADQLREMARHLNQPVRLDFAFDLKTHVKGR